MRLCILRSVKSKIILELSLRNDSRVWSPLSDVIVGLDGELDLSFVDAFLTSFENAFDAAFLEGFIEIVLSNWINRFRIPVSKCYQLLSINGPFNQRIHLLGVLMADS